MPLVSVIVPCYNAEQYVGEAIRSILSQSLRDLEVIVVDDGSTDDTSTVLEEVTDPRVKVISANHGGVSRARNLGLAAASGALLAFLDADDRWLPTKLEKQVRAFDADPDVGFVFSNFVRFTNDGQYLSDQFQFAPELSHLPTEAHGDGVQVIVGNALESLLTIADMPWYPPANMVRASVVEGLLFEEELRIAEDVANFVQVWARTKAAYIPEILTEVRRHETNTTRTMDRPSQLMRIDVLKDFLQSCSTGAHRRAVLRRIGREWAGLGHGSFWHGSLGTSVRAYCRAVTYPGARVTALKHLAAMPVALVLRRLQARSEV